MLPDARTPDPTGREGTPSRRKTPLIQSRKVRYAVVGAGWISQASFMPAVAHTGNSELFALVTGDAAKALELMRRYGLHAHGYEAYDAVVSSSLVDAVYIALPNFMHRDYAVRALNAGKHVLLEKPMAVNEAECRLIQDAARRGGAKLMVAYRLHNEPGTLEAIRLVREGVIGEPRAFSAVFCQRVASTNHRARNGFDCGPVADMGTYPINAVRALFDAEPVVVSAHGVRSAASGFDFDDTVSVTLVFPGERIAQFTVSYGAAATDQYRVVGTRGDLEVSPGFGMAIRHRLTVDGETSLREFERSDQFGAELKYFSDCILEARDPEPDSEEGLADVRVIDAIRLSLASGKPQRLSSSPRRHRVEPDQAIFLPPVEAPPIVRANAPNQG